MSRVLAWFRRPDLADAIETNTAVVQRVTAQMAALTKSIAAGPGRR